MDLRRERDLRPEGGRHVLAGLDVPGTRHRTARVSLGCDAANLHRDGCRQAHTDRMESKLRGRRHEELGVPRRENGVGIRGSADCLIRRSALRCINESSRPGRRSPPHRELLPGDVLPSDLNQDSTPRPEPQYSPPQVEIHVGMAERLPTTVASRPEDEHESSIQQLSFFRTR